MYNGNMWNIGEDGKHNCIREWWNIDAFIYTEKLCSNASFECF